MPEPAALRPAVFLDRDGTISEEVGYLNHLSRFRMFEFAGEAIRRLNAAGWPVFVVTNQSGVARGLFAESLIGEVHAEMNRQLAAAGAKLDGIYYCPHRPEDGCECRKPKAGLLERAAPAPAACWSRRATAAASWKRTPPSGRRSPITSRKT